MTDKPEYRVPLLADLDPPADDAPTVLSTFSGCGGSCLGFRLAGYRVLWASEFVPAARATYRANFPDTPVDDRDVREIDPAKILTALEVERGDVDVVEGSPPCSSFSMSGRRERGWGEEHAYSDTKQRTDDLFAEYVRIVDGVRPRVFVAENVAGLAKGTARGHLKRIMGEMRALGYRLDARVLDAQWLGVPQRRQRLIFVGVRDDLDLDPAFPYPLPYRYSIADALPWLDGATLHGRTGPGFVDRSHRVEEPAPAVLAGNEHTRYEVEGDGPSLDGYALGDEWDRLAPGETSDRYFNLIRPHVEEPCPTVTQLGGSNPGVASVTHPTERRKFTIAELRRLCGFPDDFVLTGSYSQQWERLGRAVPPPMMAQVASTLRQEILDALRR